MDKSAIKNFSIWARNKLIADITYKAGLLGVTEDGIKDALPQSTLDAEFYDIGTKEPYAIHGEEIKQRKELVDAIKRKTSQIDCKDAYRNVVEEVAYTWFNRLIAIRFMEVNDYMPAHIRVLSSESKNKLEPDLVTTPFDAELEFTQAETEKIMQMKNDNQVDALFRFLFIKQCNALNTYLPRLFEKTSDYTELLLNVSVTDQDGIVYHLTHDINEDDFNISNIGEDGRPTGQVEIIGWMYQYYNTEPKDEAFALLKKNVKITKERIPAATQLFTPDWIVRYMVENSVGRLWLEGHEDNNLKNEWKYYLDEAEQEADVAEQLRAIREEYKNIKPEEIKVIDPCMGSGHILVYAFDVLMQIYESYGYSQRDAAKSIVENNIFGLDIDDRAFQLAYFAIMMKARSYNRRFLTLEIEPNLCAIQESNGLQYEQDMGDFLLSDEQRETLKYLLSTFVDAKEYGSILNVEKRDYDGFLEAWKQIAEASLGNVVMMLWYNKCNQIIPILARQASILSGKYDVVVTNPPYMSSGGMNKKLTDFVKKEYPETRNDMFACCMDKGLRMVKHCGFMAMITMESWMFLPVFEVFRKCLLSSVTIDSLIHMPYLGKGGTSMGISFGTAAYVFSMNHNERFLAAYQCIRYYETDDSGVPFSFPTVNERKSVKAIKDFKTIQSEPVAYWASESVFDNFSTLKTLDNYIDARSGISTGDNNMYYRCWFECNMSKIAFDYTQTPENSAYKWFPIIRGGDFRKWYGNMENVLNLENDGYAIKNSGNNFRLRTPAFYNKRGITWNRISSRAVSFRLKTEQVNFGENSPCMFLPEENILMTIGMLNSKVAKCFLEYINSTMTFQVLDIQSIPYLPVKDDDIERIVNECIGLAKNEWDDYETSWDFITHPFIKFNTVGDLSKTFAKWESYAQQRFDKVKENEESINRYFIKSYNLSDEISLDVAEDDITIRLSNMEADVKSFLSYAVGCMFGRYSLDKDGTVYAGNEWKESVS